MQLHGRQQLLDTIYFDPRLNQSSDKYQNSCFFLKSASDSQLSLQSNISFPFIFFKSSDSADKADIGVLSSQHWPRSLQNTCQANTVNFLIFWNDQLIQHDPALSHIMADQYIIYPCLHFIPLHPHQLIPISVLKIAVNSEYLQKSSVRKCGSYFHI